MLQEVCEIYNGGVDDRKWREWVRKEISMAQ